MLMAVKHILHFAIWGKYIFTIVDINSTVPITQSNEVDQNFEYDMSMAKKGLQFFSCAKEYT